MDVLRAIMNQEANALTAEQQPAFKIYLTKSGVLDLLTNALSCVFHEYDKSVNVMNCLKVKIVAASFNPGAQKLDQLSKKVLQLVQTTDRIQEENRKLRASLGLPEVPIVPRMSGASQDVSLPASPTLSERANRVRASQPTTDKHANSYSKSISKGPGSRRKK